MPRLQYEFKHLGIAASAGYDPTYHIQTDVFNEDRVSFDFELDREDEIQKGISSSLKVFGASYQYVRSWLIDHANGSVNSILVRITDTVCNRTRGEWLVKTDSLDWCDDDICELKVTLREYWPELDCLKSTLIADNHRGWFPDDGFIPPLDLLTGAALDPFMHPRFRYCDDIKPQVLQNFLAAIAQGIMIAVYTTLMPLISILGILGAIANLLGISPPPAYTMLQNLLNDIQQLIFGELLGCDRCHPSPFVRNYFINACSKCGIDFSSTIFNDAGSDYYNIAHMFAPIKKGLKISSNRDWIQDNKPNETTWTYARSLKKAFNAKYILKKGVFYFERKDYYATAVLYDFTGADKDKLLGKICYGWSGETRPAFQKFAYVQDSFDQDGNEARHRFNSNTEWNPGGANPLLQGDDDIVIDKYSSQRYTNDGVDKKVIFVILQNQSATGLDGLLLMSADITSAGKLIEYDTTSPADLAETIKTDYSLFAATGIVWQDDYANGSMSDYSVFNWRMIYNKQANDNGYPNLYQFHAIDDPSLASKRNIEWRLDIHACCEDMETLLFDDPTSNEINPKTDYLVQLTSTLQGQIRKIELDYENMVIKLSGHVK